MPVKFFRACFINLLLLLVVIAASAQTPKSALNRIKNIDAQHYILRLSFDRTKKIVFGETTVQLKVLENNLKTIELDAVDLNFESVKLESDNKDLPYRTAGEKIYITLDRAYSPADLMSLRFKYSTKPKKGVYFVDAQKDKHSAQVWTQNEPEDARFWFPSNDFPDDKATSEELITVEKGETVIGNGELLETIENPDQTSTFHYRMSVPHSTYLISFVVGNYAKVSEKYKDIPLGFYVYPENTAIVPMAFGKTREMLRIYEQLTGVDFPFPKYDQTIVANFSEFSGMENITATTLADNDVYFAQFQAAQGLVEDLVSHELAHSWFGDLVTCKNWSELWLNEGFATYMEAAYREKMYGRENYLQKIRENVSAFQIADARSKFRPPLYNPNAVAKTLFDEPEFIYQKGGAVLHTLRETVGTENFWKAVNSYLNRHQFKNVETSDLQKAMEETSQMKLDWFFNQWIYGAGYPKLNIKQVFNAKTNLLDLTITQTQKTKNNFSPLFRLPLEIEITTAKGKKMEIVEVKNRETDFSIKLDGKPTKLIIDKDEKIPLKTVKLESLKTR